MALIKTYKSVPAVYSNQSRDFQTIGHVYEAVFNSSKLATDMLDRMMPNLDFDERLLGLSTTTVGFIRKHEYDTLDLTMILSSFAYLLRRKGTKSAIESALNILLRSQGISDKYVIDIDPQSKLLTLYLSERLEDVVLLKDLFAYILPFGFNYRIIQSAIASASGYPTKVEYVDDVEAEVITNVGIVNDTFKTTIDRVDPIVVVPSRPIRNGTADPQDYLVVNNKLHDSGGQLTAYWNVAWNKTPEDGHTYTIEVTVNYGQNEWTENYTATYTADASQGVYYWQKTFEAPGDEYLTITSNAQGTQLTLSSAGWDMLKVYLTLKVSD